MGKLLDFAVLWEYNEDIEIYGGKTMYCKNCGKEISDYAFVCPNCGVKTENPNAERNAPAEKKTNTLAIVGFILAFLIPIAGLICSIIARKQLQERDEGGAGLALAGLIISIVELVIVFIYLIVVIAAVAAVM